MVRQNATEDGSTENDLTPTGDVRRMLNGDGEHYRVTDRMRSDNTRYFVVRGDSDMATTFKSFIRNATDYEVVDFERRRDTFRAEIERE